MENEIWKTWREKQGRKVKIEVSNEGNVKLNGKLKIMPTLDNKYYYSVCGIYVHRMVGELFVPNPNNKPEIDHIDTNRHNNNANNLRWVTRKENLNNPNTKNNYSKVRKGKFWGNWDEQGLQNLRKSMIVRNSKPEYKKKLSLINKNTHRMSNGIERKFIKYDKVDYYLSLGWHFGWK